jgi:hypothetical protein
MNRPVYDPEIAGNNLRIPPWEIEKENQQLSLFKESGAK